MKRTIVLISIVSIPIYFYVLWYLLRLRELLFGFFLFELIVTGSISNAGVFMYYFGLILLFAFGILGGIVTYAFLLWLARLYDQTI